MAKVSKSFINALRKVRLSAQYMALFTLLKIACTLSRLRKHAYLGNFLSWILGLGF